jgi:dTDP-4-dehydrorhamnose 3,5-epimerase
MSTADYGRGKDLAPRPRHSTLDLSKIASTGFEPADVAERLAEYVGASAGTRGT